MALEVIGKLIEKNDTQQVTERFKKREFVLDISEEVNGTTYQNYAKMQLVQDRCDKLNAFQVGDVIKVSFNIRGNRWEKDGKVNYINSLDAWRIEHANNSNEAVQRPNNQYNNSNNNSYSNQGNNFSNSQSGFAQPMQGAAPADDLPF